MAITITRQLVSIDDELTFDGLLDEWVNGNRLSVLSKLGKDHPGLVAGFLAGGSTFLCPECGSISHPQAARVYYVNIRPYSQSCHACGRRVELRTFRQTEGLRWNFSA